MAPMWADSPCDSKNNIQKKIKGESVWYPRIYKSLENPKKCLIFPEEKFFSPRRKNLQEKYFPADRKKPNSENPKMGLIFKEKKENRLFRQKFS